MPKYIERNSSQSTAQGYELVTLTSGTKIWYLNGERHREDGPAYEGIRNNKEWWLNGEQLDFEWFLKNPNRINEMQAWELLEPEELVRLVRC